MEKRLPVGIVESIEKGARRFGMGLEMLEYPNNGKDGPPSEINALLNVGFFLQSLPEPFEMYAEGSCAKGRIDAMGFNGKIAFALEAKAFGGINAQAESALRDLQRMRAFFPEMTTKLTGALQPRDWWQDAEERWGIILISSFRGKWIADAWASDSTDIFLQEMNKYDGKASRPAYDQDGNPTGFLKLYQQFSAFNRGSAFVTSGERWQDCGQGWFLWGAVPLDAKSQA